MKASAPLAGPESITMAVSRPMDGAAIYRVGQDRNLCALTFDDGPGPHTARLLDILAARGIRATFFVLGDRAARNPRLVRRMVDEGHEVANHTYSHKSLRQLPERTQFAEIEQVQEVLRAQGVPSRYLRPPFGRYDAATLRIAAELGLELVLWSVDSNDWQKRVHVDSMQSVYGRPARNGIILFHDTHQPTVDVMDTILDGLVAGQCRFVTVSEFMDEARHPERFELPETPVRYVEGDHSMTANATSPTGTPRATAPASSMAPLQQAAEGEREHATPTASGYATPSGHATPSSVPVPPSEAPHDGDSAATQAARPAESTRPDWLPSVIGTFRSWARGVLSDSSAHSAP